MNNHQECSICKTIPGSSDAFWKGGELQSNSIPASESKLEIIGAPFYKEDTSSSNSLIKRCPECGTFYKWDFEYEYLVNGSEDTITITRVSGKQAEKQIREIFFTIKLSESLFRKQALYIIKALRNNPNPSIKKMKEAADLFFYNELKGFNISFAVKDLIETLKKHTHTKKNYCPGTSLVSTLKKFAQKNEINKIILGSLLENSSLKEMPPEIKELVNFCK